MSRPRRRRRARDLARCRRRLRLQGPAEPRGGRRSPGSRGAPATRCAGSRIAASISPPTPIAASITTASPATPTPTDGCSASTARRASMPAPFRSIRPPRRWRRRRSRACFPVPMTSSPIAAARRRSPPTSARSCPIAGSRAPACAWRIEVIMDAIAREAGIEPYEARLRNLVRPEQMPFENVLKKQFDGGDYPECLRRAVAAIDLAGMRARQQRGEPDGRLVGVGFAIFCEQGAHGNGGAVPAGAVPSFQATSRRQCGSRPTAISRSASAPIRTARGTRRRSRRSRTRCSASTSSASRSCKAIRSTARFRPAPGRRARS